MLTDDLFNNILFSPIACGADHLHVISGYATAAMAFHHINYIKEKKLSIKVNLIVGMCPNDGLSISNHHGFKKLVNDDFSGIFECSYITDRPAVHSKVYIWTRENKPIFGFVGSANYTQNAFRPTQKEAMTSCDAKKAFAYYQDIIPNTIYCTHNDAENLIQLYKDNYLRRKNQIIEQKGLGKTTPDYIMGLPKVTVSLLANNGTLPKRSGLNWGQRPDQNREPNQAYIRLPASVYHTNFFPENKVHFTILTDDRKTIICTRAQQNGKAIHTPHNNSLIGEYFRNRLCLPSGALVTKEDLAKYGRNDITFYKIDDETYYMDFAV